VVITDIEPFGLLVLVRINELVHQVLVGRVFSHLDASPSDYSWVVGAGLRLQTEKLPKQDLVGLNSHERFTEVDEYGDMENTIGVQVQVFDTIVLEETLEEIAGREC
jgi:hypothetical protein